MITVEGLDQVEAFCHEVDLAFAAMERSISERFDAFTHKLFSELVYTTPQWTGDLASNWNYSIGYVDESYSMIPNKAEAGQHWSKADIYVRGANPAVAEAVARAAGIHPTWRDIVYFTNATPIAEAVENLTVLVRPINLVDGQVGMARYYYDKYSRGGRW